MLNTQIHPCIVCKYSSAFNKPISMDIGSHLHMTFACGKSSLPNAYGQKLNTNIMVLDLIAPKNKVWVDGGVTIPDTGCENFEKSRLAENEVMLHVQQYS